MFSKIETAALAAEIRTDAAAADKIAEWPSKEWMREFGRRRKLTTKVGEIPGLVRVERRPLTAD